VTSRPGRYDVAPGRAISADRVEELLLVGDRQVVQGPVEQLADIKPQSFDIESFDV
jgi:hypothetical protein